MERRMRADKERKFNKWRLLKEEFRKKQTVCAAKEVQYISPDLSPSQSLRKLTINQSSLPADAISPAQLSPATLEGSTSTFKQTLGARFREYLLEKLEKNKNA